MCDSLYVRPYSSVTDIVRVRPSPILFFLVLSQLNLLLPTRASGLMTSRTHFGIRGSWPVVSVQATCIVDRPADNKFPAWHFDFSSSLEALSV